METPCDSELDVYICFSIGPYINIKNKGGGKNAM